ncbi:dihydroxy-acid dehydratase domain-containing protein [Halomonas sp. AOP29-A2-28]|uniref:dihydroxy-acid dehydratase domain-containing protein n=1 Tax=Halomonas sp. AOP29-A2-28 TaxID=3457705 RepID=UPI0040337C87
MGQSKDGIREAGGNSSSFLCTPFARKCGVRQRRWNATWLTWDSAEFLHDYPLDGVVLDTGCEKTTLFCLMAAPTVNIPAIMLSGGPMFNGWRGNESIGSGSISWALCKRLAAGDIGYDEFLFRATKSASSIGRGKCDTSVHAEWPLLAEAV